MKFDIDQTLEEMVQAMKEVFDGEYKSLQDFCENVFHTNKDDIRKLGERRISGELSQEKFESKMEDQLDALTTEMLAQTVKIKKLAQEAVNSALEVLYTAVQNALK